MAKKLYLDNTIEFLRGRVYLGAYDYIPEDTSDVTFFTMEEELFYNSFHLDFGPFNIGHLYRFAVKLHDLLTREENLSRAVVFYSSTSTRQRANAACLLCCYMILIQSWTPHQVLQPISQVDPPFMPFRDAGYSNADFEITIQDICYGCWRAKECGLIDLQKMDLDSYEYYERVENGDLNVLTPNFIAFASPKENVADMNNNHNTKINRTFRKVLDIFQKTNVQLVVRLNSHLYNKVHFENNGIQHLDMIFEDGSCPDLSIVTNFIGSVETIINEFDDLNDQAPKIAVHCKAGLGRTGCLIGAYLVYKHGFTANECIGFLRVIRPGMVVGPQQHWLYLNQQTFREWKYTMKMSIKPSDLINGMYPLISVEEYKKQKKERLQQQQQQQQQQQKQQQHHHHHHGKKLQLLQHERKTSNNDEGLDENSKEIDQADLSGIIIPPETASPMTNSLRHGVPMRSPGQPRKGQHGANTIEDINSLPGKRAKSKTAIVNKNSSSNNNANTTQENLENEADVSMTSRRNITPIDDQDMKMLYVAKQQQRRSGGRNLSSSSSAMTNTMHSANHLGQNGGNFSRAVSGGNVRKISGSYRKDSKY